MGIKGYLTEQFVSDSCRSGQLSDFFFFSIKQHIHILCT